MLPKSGHFWLETHKNHQFFGFDGKTLQTCPLPIPLRPCGFVHRKGSNFPSQPAEEVWSNDSELCVTCIRLLRRVVNGQENTGAHVRHDEPQSAEPSNAGLVQLSDDPLELLTEGLGSNMILDVELEEDENTKVSPKLPQCKNMRPMKERKDSQDSDTRQH